jgi:malonyl CoA-acyl carrier protein transacylase
LTKDKNQNKTSSTGNIPLAIIGIGCLFPKAANVNEYWTNIREGVYAITDIPESHWKPEDYFHSDQTIPDMTYARRGGFIDPVDFNPLLYGMSPNNIEATDTTQLLGMVVARQALLDAGYSTGKDTGDGKEFDRDRASVILGVTGTLELVIPLGARLGHPIWRKALLDAGVDPDTAEDVVQRIAESYVPWQENSFPGLLGNVTAGRIANRFDLGGTNCAVDAACASSLNAIHLAAMELSAGRCDIAITGGMDTFNDIFMYMCFSKTPALSPTGNSRPFDHKGDGTILGEGLGAIVLKRLDDAKQDGDHIYAMIRGIGTSSDGRGNAIYAPSATGQTKALKDAYAQANVTPASIELVEAHGTGTQVGDAVEAEALAGVYRQDKPDGSWCAIGSVKSMIGHTKAAAGIAGLIKAVMALEHKVLPPTIKVDQPLSQLEPGQAPAYINTIKRPWVSNEKYPRRAAISAFGFGGSNFHCVLEEAESVKRDIEWDGRVILFAFSADSEDQLGSQLEIIDAEQPWPQLRLMATQSCAAFDKDKDHRLILVVEKDKTDFVRSIQDAIRLLSEQSDVSFWKLPTGASYGYGKRTSKTGILFPGQGSQYVGMLRDLVCQFPQMLATLEHANTTVSGREHGQRLSDFIYPIPVFTEEARNQQEEILRATQNAQPAIGTVSLAALSVLEHFGVKADATAGHSYGELVALCAAGCIDETSLYRLSKRRGELMAKGEGDRGAMLAIAAPVEDVQKFLNEENLDLVIANHNAPAQVVLSGASDQIGQAEQLCKQRELRATKLPVAAAFHSDFVADAEKPFSEMLASIEFKDANVKVFSNSTAECYPEDSKSVTQCLASQLAKPVQFVREIENMYAQGVHTFVEVGPGNRLTGLVKSILDGKDFQAFALDASSGKRHGQYDLANLLASLCVLDHSIEIDRWDAGYLDSVETDMDTKPAMTIPICGANYVMPREKKPLRKIQKQAQTTTRMEQNTLSDQELKQTIKTDIKQLPISEDVNSSQVNKALYATQQSILTLQKMQEQTANLHRQYLEGQETAQRTIQQLLEQQQRMLGISTVLPATESRISTNDTAQSAAAPEIVKREVIEETKEEVKATPATIESVDTTHNRIDIQKILLEVISEKTGYPIEMLSLDMSLDTDLGIDSIKRVEILSALQERLPWAPTVNPEDLGTFHFLEHIIEFMLAGAQDKKVVVAPVADKVASLSDTEVQQVLLEVVADKTGYPMEMLNLDMNLDTDLGIDSIKRVEILSALQERLPEMPVVKPEDLGALQTLQQIVDFMSGLPEITKQARPEITQSEALQESHHIERSIVTVVPLTNESHRRRITLSEKNVVWIVAEQNKLTQTICVVFKEKGIVTKIVQANAKPDASLAGLIILAPIDPKEGYIKDIFQLIQKAGPYLRKNNQEGNTILVSGTQMGGNFGLSGLAETSPNPNSAGLAGLIKTADKEWLEVCCKSLDFAADENSEKALAVMIVDECLLKGPLEVGISGNQRYSLALESSPIPHKNENPLFSKDDVVVITGGARGVTAEVAVALAETYKPNLLLLGRTPEPKQDPEWLHGLQDESGIKKAIIAHKKSKKPSPKTIEKEYRNIISNREIRTNLDRIQATGVNVHYKSVDVRDFDAVATIIDDARRNLGPIRGFIHGAGVLADRLIEDKTEEQFAQVYSTKVDGLYSLLRATEKDDLKIMVMFSSSTGRFGRTGQADYAAANEVLNKTAQQQKISRPDCRVLSVNWGPWDGGMVTPGLKKIFKSEGVEVIPLKAGAEYLMQEISQDGPVEVVVLGPCTIIEQEANKNLDYASLHIAFERTLCVKEFPFLKSHVMNSRAVLPVAVITEWFIHGAIHDNPGLNFLGFDDLRVFKGVTLEPNASIKLQIMAGLANKSGEIEIVPVELRSGKTLHARALVILSFNRSEQPAATIQIPTDKHPYNNMDIYTSGQLFHGTDLQGIISVDYCSEQGMVAHVKAAPHPDKWMKKPVRSSWHADPLALDASFQMMILWSFDQLGIGSLPTAIKSYRQYQRNFPKEGTQILIRVNEYTKFRAEASIEFLDNNGGLVARIEGYECVTDASLNDAFKKNELTEPV